MRYLLNQPRLIREMGAKAHTFVRENFLLTRQLREYLTLGVGVLTGKQEWIELG
jgi:trehalose synthase